MPIRTPHFPDLLFSSARRLRAWETALMALLARHGFQELHPSLVLREPMDEDTLRFFDGSELVALRWDFTLALARTLVARFQDPPARVSYAGAVFRRALNPWEPVERFEVGCERVQADEEGCDASDLELATILMALPATLGLAFSLCFPSATDPTSTTINNLMFMLNIVVNVMRIDLTKKYLPLTLLFIPIL